MTSVQSISFDQRTPDKQLRTPLRSEDLTWHRNRQKLDADASSIDSDSDSDSEASSSNASESSSDVSTSSASSSDQEDDSDSDSDSDSVSEYDLSLSEQESEGDQFSSNEGGRSTESLSYRRSGANRQLFGLDTSSNTNTLTTNLLATLGVMARTDNVGFIALLVPFTGICTMLSTELLACANHFSCSENFPTLSYAATFRPEGYAFTGGMCLTAIFIFASVTLFFWYVRLRLRSRSQQQQQLAAGTEGGTTASYMVLVFGVTSAISLFGLAVFDMRTNHDTHINFTIIFFISAWVMMIAVHTARKSILQEDETAAADGKLSSSAGLLVVLRRRSFWLSLRRWRRLDCSTAYTLGRLMLNIGLASTFLFGIFFLCANDVWPNPLGFTGVQEAFFEALAIVCQLLFMGTLSCELARLARLVEHSDYTELERSE